MRLWQLMGFRNAQPNQPPPPGAVPLVLGVAGAVSPVIPDVLLAPEPGKVLLSGGGGGVTALFGSFRLQACKLNAVAADNTKTTTAPRRLLILMKVSL